MQNKSKNSNTKNVETKKKWIVITVPTQAAAKLKFSLVSGSKIVLKWCST